MDTDTRKYTVSETPLGKTRHVRIVTIGAGASGLNMIRTLRETLNNYEHVVYEKNPSVGGTWYENRYPGCMCDIPAHNYQFSWKHNTCWSTFFAGAEEIENYLCRVCEEENLGPSIKVLHQVTAATWNEEESVWKLKVQNLRTSEVFDDYCHFLLNASGILNNWKWPDIAGLDTFKGDLIHTANWPKDFDITGKRVAVIGNGSSGVQIMPAIQKDVKQLFQFLRSPLWIVPPVQQLLSQSVDILKELKMDGTKFTTEQIVKFTSDPEYYLRFVKAVEEEINRSFLRLNKGSEAAKYAKQSLTEYMTTTLGNDQDLVKALVPDFAVGCRRTTPAIGYMECLREENVRVVTDPIDSVVENGIKTATGEVVEIDVLICATGFDVGFCPRFPIIGRKGNLQDLWKESLPRAYMSSSIPDFPNYFMFLGPNAPIGHGSVITIIEHVATYIASIIQKCQTESILSLSPTYDALDDFYEHIEAFMPRTAWADTCRSWFKNGKETGPVIALHPGSRIHWFVMLEKFRGEDFEFRYVTKGKSERGNRFGYLGNGISVRELEEGGDKTWYLGSVEESKL